MGNAAIRGLAVTALAVPVSAAANSTLAALMVTGALRSTELDRLKKEKTLGGASALALCATAKESTPWAELPHSKREAVDEASETATALERMATRPPARSEIMPAHISGVEVQEPKRKRIIKNTQ
jgi:hypothetical protein